MRTFRGQIGTGSRHTFQVTAAGPGSAARKVWRLYKTAGAFWPKACVLWDDRKETIVQRAKVSRVWYFEYTSLYSDGTPRPINWSRYRRVTK